MDIAEWLRGLGLGQFVPAFAENEVDHGDRKKGSTFGFDATAQIRILQPWLGQQVDLSAQ